MTTVHTLDGFTYRLTSEDYLWLGRAASGEGPNTAGYIWTWLQRYAAGQTAGGRYYRELFPSLTAMVRAHSQPVNPIWARGGSRCPVPSPSETSPCSEVKLQRRERYSNLAPLEFPVRVQLALAELRASALPNPLPRSIDFAVCDTPGGVDAQIARGSDFRVLSRDGGCFVSNTYSRAWPDGFVFLKPSSWLWPAIGGFTLGAAVLGGWLWWRSR